MEPTKILEQHKSVYEEGMQQFFQILKELVGENGVKVLLKKISKIENPTEKLFVAVNTLQDI